MGRFRGVYAVTLTPFDNDDRIDEDTLEHHTNHLVDEGVHGIICLGSTGEFASLSDDERDTVLSGTVRAVSGRVPVLAGASANSSRDVIRYCNRARELGADGVMLVHPYYCRPSQQELCEHYRYVAEQIDLPIMIYNNPLTSGVDLLPETIHELSALDSIQYIKECSGDARRCGEIIRLCGNRLGVFAGADDLFLESFMHGASGWVCGAANVLPREMVRIFDLAVNYNDIGAAREYAGPMYPLLFMIETEGAFVQYLKAAMDIIGRPMGIPRRPMLKVSADVRSRLEAAIFRARTDTRQGE